MSRSLHLSKQEMLVVWTREIIVGVVRSSQIVNVSKDRVKNSLMD